MVELEKLSSCITDVERNAKTCDTEIRHLREELDAMKGVVGVNPTTTGAYSSVEQAKIAESSMFSVLHKIVFRTDQLC